MISIVTPSTAENGRFRESRASRSFAPESRPSDANSRRSTIPQRRELEMDFMYVILYVF